jgi:streptogrisin C
MRRSMMARGAAAMTIAAMVVLHAGGAGALEHHEPDTSAPPAKEHREPETGERAIDAKSATLDDAKLIAETYGWRFEEALEHLEQSRRFARLTAALAEKHPDAYASAALGERPGAPAVIRFVGEPPADALAEIEGSRLPVKAQGGAKYSEQELQKRAVAVHDHLVRSGFAQVVTATTPTDGVLASVFGDGQLELPSDLRDGVEVTPSARPIATDEHTRGGAFLLDDGTFECTSGFTVAAPNGTTGVATAGHCTGLNQYQQPEDGLTYAMAHQAQHVGLFGDVEWKTTTHLEPAEFFARANEIRQVNSLSVSLPVNTPSCVYGRSSNARACDQVFSTFVTVTTSAGTASFLMAMDSDNTIPGDSGGPWSFATEADGIHKGDTTISGGVRNVWSRAALLPLSLGVSVRTQ